MTKILNIAVDAMGGEGSPKKTIDGIIHHSKSTKNINYNIFGDETEINKFFKDLKNNTFKIFDTKDKILDTDSPLTAARKGKNSSMWKAIESVKSKESDIVISAGNTGALFVIAKMNLEMIENIDKPALSALWPNKSGMNVVLDLGANIECSEKNLTDFAIMGSSLFRSLFPKEQPKVALLNIGSEDIKGNETIKSAHKILSEKKKSNEFNFAGYVEGNNIMSGDVNVIVTDGFTGNIALKTAEGTANFVMKEVKNSMTSNLYGKVLSFLNIKNIKKVKDKLDPRLYNGAILIGLNSPVVKSHGSTDYIGFSNSLKVCEKIVNGNLIEKIKDNIIS